MEEQSPMLSLKRRREPGAVRDEDSDWTDDYNLYKKTRQVGWCCPGFIEIPLIRSIQSDSTVADNSGVANENGTGNEDETVSVVKLQNEGLATSIVEYNVQQHHQSQPTNVSLAVSPEFLRAVIPRISQMQFELSSQVDMLKTLIINHAYEYLDSSIGERIQDPNQLMHESEAALQEIANQYYNVASNVLNSTLKDFLESLRQNTSQHH
ncbi:hypothetical protein V1511DRAFT_509011 [Dipodascopsis uninucleata]